MRWTLADTYDDADCPVAGLYVARPRTPDSLVEVRDYAEEIPENAVVYQTASLEYPLDTFEFYEDANGNGGDYSAIQLTYINQDFPTTNYGTNVRARLTGGAAGDANNKKRILVRLPDIFGTNRGQIPPGARVLSAVLSLYAANTDEGDSQGGGGLVYRLLQPWTEAGATWNTYDGSNDWDTAGAGGADVDYNAEPDDPLSRTLGTAGFEDDQAFNVASGVQAWIDGTTANQGWIIREAGTSASGIFYSDDATGGASNPPRLAVAIATIIPSGVGLAATPSGSYLITDQWASGIIGTRPAPLSLAYEPRYDVVGIVPSRAIVVRTGDQDKIDPKRYVVQVGDQPLAPSGYPGRYDRRIDWSLEPSGTVHRTRLMLPVDVFDPGVPLTIEYPAFQFDQTVRYREYINPVPLYRIGTDWSVTDQGWINLGNRLLNSTEVAVQRHPLWHVQTLSVIGSEQGAWPPRIRRGVFGLYDVTDPSGRIVYSVPQTDPTAVDASLIDTIPVQTSRVRGESVARLDDYTIQVPRTPLMIESSGVLLDDRGVATDPRENEGYPWYVPMELTDPGVGVRTYLDGTPSGVTVYAGETRIPNEDIADWDSWNGLIRFRRPLPAADTIYVSYRYQVQDVEIKNLDLNPRLDNQVWASGAIRVVQTPDRLAWHYTADFPSGVYGSDDYGWSVDPVRARVPLASGLVLGEYLLKPYTPDELTIVDIRRPGGGVRPALLDDLTESSHYLDVE